MSLTVAATLDAGTRRFLALAWRQPPLNRNQEAALLARARRGDGEAVDRVVAANLCHVADLALDVRTSDDGLDVADYCAEGTAALVSAVRRYRPERHGPFKPHALRRIRRAMLDPGA